MINLEIILLIYPNKTKLDNNNQIVFKNKTKKFKNKIKNYKKE